MFYDQINPALVRRFFLTILLTPHYVIACQMFPFHLSFQGDILKCVVNMDSRARAHWLSTAVFTWRQFLNAMYIYLTK